MIVLDTSALIDLFRGGEEIRKALGDDVASTAVNYHEIFAGIKHHKAKAEERFFRRFFSDIKILDLNLIAAERSSEIAGRLLALGTVVNSVDVLIAGIAVANGAETLITRDRDFESISRVTELDIKVY
ncbi:tRNA(fMet)-specific endonuclease VapC [uncultured archaeon]|nr:tRNA(fMet)-specific endonuclease VapC [uncultured archaeon]